MAAIVATHVFEPTTIEPLSLNNQADHGYLVRMGFIFKGFGRMKSSWIIVMINYSLELIETAVGFSGESA
jgi:hypothetical protein